VGVMVRGRWYSQVELMNELEKLAKRFRPAMEVTGSSLE
jgi:hypothetical protein